jgi:Xaa-Pro aminopeptidase/Xaa-Pro dipeptidase
MPLKNKNLTERRDRLQTIFSTHQMDSLLIFNMSNIRYLSGFSGSEGILFITRGETVLVIDGRYTGQAALETVGIRIQESSDKIRTIVQIIQQKKLQRIGLEADSLALSQYHELAAPFQEKSFLSVTGELRMLRAYKDETEIACMRKAAGIASAAIGTLIHRMKPGWTEKETALQLELLARQSGADGLSFEPIVASGPHSALPHARPTNRKIRKGDFVVIDFGVRYRGYCSDETCTVGIGKLTGRQKNAYQIVKEAHDRALDAIAADVPCAEIDRRARHAFGKYRKYFVHGTGHGVGLDVHEAPRLSATSTDILKPGMVFTVEPGLYIPGLWGIRIEDTIFLKKNSCEKLTKMDKELTIIE